MRGRKPKPIAQRIAEGDARKIGVNKLQEKLDAQPQARSGYPECPSHLKGLARKTYKFLAEQAEEMEIAKRPDYLMIEGAAVNYARAVAADIALETDGITFEVKGIIGKGDTAEVVVLDIKTRPEVGVSDKCWKNFKAFATEFGFSPVSLTRIHLSGTAKKEDDLAELLSAPREPRKFAVQ